MRFISSTVGYEMLQDCAAMKMRWDGTCGGKTFRFIRPIYHWSHTSSHVQQGRQHRIDSSSYAKPNVCTKPSIRDGARTNIMLLRKPYAKSTPEVSAYA